MTADRTNVTEAALNLLGLYSPGFMASPGTFAIEGFEVLDYFTGLDHSLLGVFSERRAFSVLAVRRSSGEAFLFTRGTETVLEWIMDADARHVQAPYLPAGYLAHNGFTELAESFLNSDGKLSPSEVLAHRGLKPRCVAHSLGCTLSAALAVKADLRGIEHYLFEPPKLWTPAAVDHVLGLGFQFLGTIMPGDVVPEQPPASLGYAQALTEQITLPVDGVKDSWHARHTLTSVIHGLDPTFPLEPENAVA